MRKEIQDWNKKVWQLNLAEKKLKENKPNFNKEKILNIKNLIDEAWINIWELHPDQHPLTTETYKKFFGSGSHFTGSGKQ